MACHFHTATYINIYQKRRMPIANEENLHFRPFTYVILRVRLFFGRLCIDDGVASRHIFLPKLYTDIIERITISPTMIFDGFILCAHQIIDLSECTDSHTVMTLPLWRWPENMKQFENF